jgi:hypothetical protein
MAGVDAIKDPEVDNDEAQDNVKHMFAKNTTLSSSGDDMLTQECIDEMKGVEKMGGVNPLTTSDMCAQIRFVLYLGFACVPPFASMVLFSALGYGLEVHHWLLAHTVYSAYFLMGALITGLIMSAFDASSWHGWAAYLAKFLKLVLVSCLCISAILLVRYHPWAPMAVFLTMMPAWFMVIFWIEHYLSSGKDGLGASVKFMNRLKFPMGFAAIGTIVVWCVFLMTDSSVFKGFIRPENASRVVEALEMFTATQANNSVCKGDYSYVSNYTKLDILERTILEKEQDTCFPELLLWFAPLFVGATMFELTLMVTLLAKKVPFSLEHNLAEDSEFRRLKPADAAKIALCEACMRVTVCIIFATVMVTYTVNTLAGFNVEASAAANGIIFFMLNSLLVVAGFMVVAMADIRLEQLPIWKSFTTSWYFVWFCGIIALGGAPFLFVYLAANKLNQMLRRVLNCENAFDEEAEESEDIDKISSSINARVRGLTGNKVDLKKMVKSIDLLDFKSRNWTEIIVCALWVGVGMVCMQVGIARVVTLFLSWLNTMLSPLPIPAVLMIFIIVGIIMFMIPVIPGVPVYLAGGIIITGATMDKFGFWNGVILSTFVCYGLKLIAVVLQQKGIGGGLRQSAAVRQIVGVNTLTIRAIKYILSQPGKLKLAKVAILCGGPDWPTSVLTGILGLPVCDMLVGSIPVYFVIAPTCFSSAMLLQTSGDYDAIGAVIVAVAGVMQIGASLVAVFYITKCIDANKRELDEYPIDEKVKALDQLALERKDLRYEAVNWHSGFLDLKVSASGSRTGGVLGSLKYYYILRVI